MKWCGRRNERGVALVTVLMIVAAMSAVAVTLSSAVLASTSRARAIDAATQADWLVLSAEEVGRSAIMDMVGATEGRFFASMPGFDEPTLIEVQGGLITLTGRDGGNCFNVNSLANANIARTPGLTETQGASGEDLIQLLEIAEIETSDLRGVTASLADWIDEDQSPGLSGAENAFYGSPSLNYRTPGQPMVDISEIRSVRYVTPDVADALRPLLCARPGSDTFELNINTMDRAAAPLLSLAFSGALTVEAAQDLIFQRPAGGWASVETFLAEPAVREISPELRRTGLLAVDTDFVAIEAAIDFRGTRRLVEIVYAVNGPDEIKTVWRERKG
jgi:general secretion pathway protein K